MARISKKGLDYFPMNTHFMQDRVVRRLMKQEGDQALCILLAVYSFLYDGEGYYLEVDDLCFSDIAANFYNSTVQDVKRVVEAAVQGGLFDAEIYAKKQILTSADIQKQYLFVKKRARATAIREDLRLCSAENEPCREDTAAESLPGDAVQADTAAGKNDAGEAESATLKVQNVTLIPQSKEKHSKAKHSIAEDRKEHLLLNPPPSEGEEPEEEQEVGLRDTEKRQGRKVRTMADILKLSPPADGQQRNYAGLLESMSLYSIPPDEQYAIIRKSNFGLIGHPVWRGLYTLRGCGGKIKLPGRYLLSL